MRAPTSLEKWFGRPRSGGGRRLIVAAAGATVLALGVPVVAAVAGGGDDNRNGHRGGHHGDNKGADTVLKNGFIYTVAKKKKVADALAIDNGKIVYVGGNRGVRRFIDRG